MAHYAIVCPDDAGGFLPIGSVGHALVERGHRVTLVSGPQCAVLAERLGLPFVSLETNDIERRKTPVVWAAAWVVGAAGFIGLRNWFRWYGDVILQRLPGILEGLGVDGVLFHQNVWAGGTVAERIGIPYVSICSSLPLYEDPGVPPCFTTWPYDASWRGIARNRLGYASARWFIASLLDLVNDYRRRWGLQRVKHYGDLYSPLAQIWQMCPEFDFPRVNLPRNIHYIGSLGTARRSAKGDDFPWDRLDGRPLIFASLGTATPRKNPPVLRRILDACEPLDAQVVLALGKWHDKHGLANFDLGPIPANAVAVDFAPQLELLDRAALLITHAGVNTVLEAICRGVPMVSLPRSADQCGMSARIEHAGVGLSDSFSKGSVAKLRSLVQRVLVEPEFRRRAGALRESMLRAGGAARVAEIAEQACSTRQPVLRAE